MTLRSNDQFNTTVYGYHDRFRGIKGTRDVVLMNRADMAELGLAEHDKVDLVGDEGTNGDKRVDGLLVVPYDIPRGCLGGYYPECNMFLRGNPYRCGWRRQPDPRCDPRRRPIEPLRQRQGSRVVGRPAAAVACPRRLRALGRCGGRRGA
jgi:hypothetical protein